MSLLDEAVVLNDGSLMPKVGLIADNEDSVAKAVDAGYRLVDCPTEKKINLNEISPQLYVEIQISEEIKTREEMRDNFKNIRHNIVSNHADLCLLRLSDDMDRNKKVWQELEQLKIQGWVKTLGLVNATSDDLADLLKNAKVKPSVVQISYEDPTLINMARKNKMQVEMPVEGDIDAFAELADNYKTSSLELVMRYFNQKGIVPLINAEDIIKNPKTDFTIKPNDLETIGQLFTSK